MSHEDAQPDHPHREYICDACGNADPDATFCHMCNEVRCRACLPEHLTLAHRPLDPAYDVHSPRHRPPLTDLQLLPLTTTDEICAHCLRGDRVATICTYCAYWFCPTCMRCHVCQTYSDTVATAPPASHTPHPSRMPHGSHIC